MFPAHRPVPAPTFRLVDGRRHSPRGNPRNQTSIFRRAAPAEGGFSCLLRGTYAPHALYIARKILARKEPPGNASRLGCGRNGFIHTNPGV